MKRIAFSVGLICAFLSPHQPLSGQDAPPVCEFNMVGTWQLTTEGQANPTLLRFKPNGTVTVISQNGTAQSPDWQATEWSRYKLDNPKSPKVIRLSPIRNHGEVVEPLKETTIDITSFDDGTFISEVNSNAGTELTRWTRLDPYRYFVVLAAAKGTPGYGSPAFAMLIKTDGHDSQTESFGLYETDSVHHYVEVGTMADEIRKKFGNEPHDDSWAMLRLEVPAGPFERAMNVMKSWERRAHENTLLYPDLPYLDNAVYLNQLASSLNDCSETIKLEKLTWRIDDPIITTHNLPQVPYFFIKDLRQRNNKLHVPDAKFHESWQAINLPPTR